MLAKVIAWAPTRDAAIERLNRGLEETDVRGVVTNIPFLSALVTHPEVRANAIDTGFIERELKNLTPAPTVTGDLELCAAVAAILCEEAKAARRDAHSPWRTFGLDAGRPAAAAIHVPAGAGRRAQGDAALWQRSRDADRSADAKWLSRLPMQMAAASISTLDGDRNPISSSVIEGHELYLRTRNGRFDLHWVDPFGGDDEEQVGEDKIVAPLPGTVVALLAEVGAHAGEGRADSDA